MAKKKLTQRQAHTKKWGESFDPEIRTKVFTQAEWIIFKFGSPRKLARALALCGFKRDPSVIFRWTYSKERGGTGGMIPTSAQLEIAQTARKAGIVLSETDWRIEPSKREYMVIPRLKRVRKKPAKKA